MGAMLVRHDASSASQVRRELTDDLERCGVTADSIDEVALVISELIGNAVRHCSDAGDLGVSWSVDAAEVLLAVDDTGAELPVVREPAPEDTSGRGLRIVNALASDWGVERTNTGKRVWARIPVAC